MLQWNYKKIIFSAAVCAGSALIFWQTRQTLQGMDLASNALDLSPAELSILPSDEPFSLPDAGTSLFDKIFSQTNAQGVREYNVPYPFTAVLQKLKETTGGIAPITTLFPMGRSLQRSAAIEGMKNVTSTDPFYRFPRLVLGFDQDSLNANGRLSLNLRGRLFIGMNEKARLLEVISYNDEAGRYEYQIVRDYEAGKTNQVTYANRQLCLSCHQNQTPIFSRAPWSESNANEKISSNLSRVLSQQLGDNISCADHPEAPYCYRDLAGKRSFYYFGAPIVVDTKIPYAIDQGVTTGNFFPAYHKLWQRLCPDLECRRDLLRQIFLYKLTGQKIQLQTAEALAFNEMIQDRWRVEFKNGMKIPQAEIPNRDPQSNYKDRGKADLSNLSGKPSSAQNDLSQVLANTDVPAELEPLVPRSPSELWLSPFINNLPYVIPKSTGLSSTSNVEEAEKKPRYNILPRLVVGYSGFFTNSDVRMIDDVLVSSKFDDSLYESLNSICNFSRSSKDTPDSVTLDCKFGSDQKGLQFSTSFSIENVANGYTGTSQLLRFSPPSSSCNTKTFATPENLSRGEACSEVDDVFIRALPLSDGSWQLFFQKRISGISVRLLDGRRLTPVKLPAIAAGESKQIALQFQIVHDFDPLLNALQQAYSSGKFKRYVDGKALNRLSVMSMVMTFLGKPLDDIDKLSKDMQTLKRSSEAPPDELVDVEKESDRAVALVNHTCGACHYNRDGVPPAYLGGPQQVWTPVQKCQHISTCAGRMLYRLKMWDCPVEDAQVKKSPMPPISRMKALNVDLETWKATDRKNIFTHLQNILPRKELLDILQKQGVSSAEAQAFITDLGKLSCPTATSTMFEKLPRCDESYSLGADLCN